MINELSIAIYNKFKSTSGDPLVNNAFYIALSGRLYRATAPQNCVEPYASYSIVDNIPEYPGGKILEHVRVNFSIFTSDISPLSSELLYDKLSALYDWCTLTISGSTLIYMNRILYVPVVEPSDNTIGCRVDYEILVDD